MKLYALALCLLPLGGSAQQLPSTSAAPQMVIKGSDIADRIAKSTVPDPTGALRHIELLLQQGGYKVNLEYHAGPSGVGLNEDVAELMVVLEGSGTILLGGTPIDPVRTGRHLQARSARGGALYALEKGDTILIPLGLAHAIGSVKSRLVLMSMHIPPMADTLPGDIRSPSSKQ
jgi:mannose-6-phosphate isomerase-like protein (cupin superfamily)